MSMYGSGSNDECYTPKYGVTPILKYIPKDAIVWCPFDKEDSEFVKQIKLNNRVISSHIDYGQDFYEYEPDYFDLIVSNPPFTGKRQIFERALSFNKPFALLMTMAWLNDSAPKQLFSNKQLQLLMFDKRIKYLNKGVINNKITFSSGYYCYNLLPKDIIMEKLDEYNSNS